MIELRWKIVGQRPVGEIRYGSPIQTEPVKRLQWREKVGVNTIIEDVPSYHKYEVTDYTDWQDVPVVEEDECK
jgi:hypothetical protein